MLDDVRGVIIGGEYVEAQLFYDKRPQSERFYGYTEHEAMEKAKERLKEEKASWREDIWKQIYPLDAWEIRVFS